MAWQNSAYNQPPHPSYYLGDGMNPPPRIAIDVEPLTTAINEATKTALRVFPNPTAHSFTIETKGAFSYKIYDLKGQMVESGKGVNQISVGAKLLKGSYVVSVAQNGKEETLKVVKE